MARKVDSHVGISGEGTPHISWDGQTTRATGGETISVTFDTGLHPDDADCLSEDYARSFVRFVGLIAEAARARSRQPASTPRDPGNRTERPLGLKRLIRR